MVNSLLSGINNSTLMVVFGIVLLLVLLLFLPAWWISRRYWRNKSAAVRIGLSVLLFVLCIIFVYAVLQSAYLIRQRGLLE